MPVVPPTTPAPAAPPALPTPAPPPSVASAPHAVVPGDHLWLIAADHLARISGRQPADLTAADIAPYWWRAVELNRSRLRSGNPNLVYPGEVVDLPPL